MKRSLFILKFYEINHFNFETIALEGPLYLAIIKYNLKLGLFWSELSWKVIYKTILHKNFIPSKGNCAFEMVTLAFETINSNGFWNKKVTSTKLLSRVLWFESFQISVSDVYPLLKGISIRSIPTLSYKNISTQS